MYSFFQVLRPTTRALFSASKDSKQSGFRPTIAPHRVHHESGIVFWWKGVPSKPQRQNSWGCWIKTQSIFSQFQIFVELPSLLYRKPNIFNRKYRLLSAFLSFNSAAPRVLPLWIGGYTFSPKKYAGFVMHTMRRDRRTKPRVFGVLTRREKCPRSGS